MTDIVFLHGFTGSHTDWFKLPGAIGKEYTTHALDITGHGESVSHKLDDYDMAKVAETIITQCPEQFHLVGYSMGGRLALYIATHYPANIQTLTLISASPGLKTEAERDARRQADNVLADKIEANGIEWFAEYWENLSLWDSQSPELKAKLHRNRLRNNPLGLANSLRSMGTGVMPSLWDELATLQMPMQLIVGELDTKFVAINREMTDLIPNVALEIIADAGHAVHLEKPDAVNTTLGQFLDTHKTS